MTSHRLLVLGDVHGDVELLAAACAAARRAGAAVVVQLGDLGYEPRTVEGRRFLAAAERACAETGILLWWLAGNHDDTSALAEHDRDPSTRAALSPRIDYLPRGHRFVMGGVRFGCLGGAYSVDRDARVEGVDWWPQEVPTMADVAALGPERLDVLLCHDAPTGVPTSPVMRALGPDVRAGVQRARDVLRTAVDRTAPRLYVHGHVHRRSDVRVPLDGGSRAVRVLSVGASRSDGWILLDLPSTTVHVPTTVGVA